MKVLILGVLKWWTLRDSNPGRYDPRRFSRLVRYVSLKFFLVQKALNIGV